MKKAKSIILMATAMLMVLGAYFVAGTYAKYTSTFEGQAKVYVARWSFASDNSATDIALGLDQTVDETTLKTGTIAPGTSGAFRVNVNSENTDVAVDFTVSITGVGNMPDNMVLYQTRTGTEGNYTYSDPFTVSEVNGALQPTVTKTGTLKANDATGLYVDVYWTWPYETGEGDTAIAAADLLDTADGTPATPQDATDPLVANEFTFAISIVGTQRPFDNTVNLESAFDL